MCMISAPPLCTRTNTNTNTNMNMSRYVAVRGGGDMQADQKRLSGRQERAVGSMHHVCVYSSSKEAPKPQATRHTTTIHTYPGLCTSEVYVYTRVHILRSGVHTHTLEW